MPFYPSHRGIFLGSSLVTATGNTLYVNGISVSGGSISGLTSIPADVVRTTGNQSVTGNKIFNGDTFTISGHGIRFLEKSSDGFLIIRGYTGAAIFSSEDYSFNDHSGRSAILFSDRFFLDAAGAIRGDWEQGILSGNWQTNTVPTLGTHLINKSYFDANNSGGGGVDATVVRTTGNQTITGTKLFQAPILLSGKYDASNFGTFTVGPSGVFDASNSQILSWQDRRLFGPGGAIWTIDYGIGKAYQLDGNNSIDWQNKKLYRASAGVSLDYSGLLLSGNWQTNTAPTLGTHIINKSYLDALAATGQSYTVARHTYSGQVVTYNINSNDNAERGAALLSAIADSRNGDVLSLAPGEFNLLSGRMNIPSGVSLRGAGISSTILRSSGTSGSVLCPGTNSTIRDLFVSGSAVVGGPSQQAVGFDLSKNQVPFTNTRFYNCRFKGEQDAFYLHDPIGTTPYYSDIEFNHCVLESNFDQAVSYTIGVSGKIVFNDCLFKTIDTLPDNPVRAVYAALGDWEWVLNNCGFNIGNTNVGSPAVTAIAADTVNNSTVTVNGGYINIYSGTSKRAFDNAGGTPYSIKAFGVKFLPLSYLGTIDFGSGIYDRLNIASGREIYSDSGTLSGKWFAASPTLSAQIATKGYVDSASGAILDSTVVRTTGNQFVGGVKTFTNGIVANDISGRYIYKSGVAGPIIDLDNSIISGNWRTNTVATQDPHLINFGEFKRRLTDGKLIYLNDDFIAGTNSDGAIGTMGWRLWGIAGATSSCGYLAAVASHPGVYRLATAAGAGNSVMLNCAPSTSVQFFDWISNGSGEINWIFRLTNTGYVQLQMGMSNATTAAPTRHVSLNYDTASGHTTFQYSTANATANFNTDSTVPADTNWHKVKMRILSPTGVGFSIDGGAETPIQTAINGQFAGPFCLVKSYSGQSTGDFDMFSMWQEINR